MKGTLKQLSSDKIIWWSTMASTGFILFSLFFLLLFYRALPPVVPLFNQLPWGAERLGPKLGLGIPLAICFGFLIGNAIINKSLYDKVPVLARMVSLTTLLTTLLTAVFVFRIVRLII